VQLLEQVFNEQFELQEAKTRFSRNAQPTGAVINHMIRRPNGRPKAKAKDKKEWVGYKVQVAETVASRKMRQRGTHAQFHHRHRAFSPPGSDQPERAGSSQPERQWAWTSPANCTSNGAYVTAEKLAQAAQEGRELIGPAARAAGKEGRFGVEDFAIEVEQRKSLSGRQTKHSMSRIERGDGQVEYRSSGRCLASHAPARQMPWAQSKHRILEVGQYHSHLQARRKDSRRQGMVTIRNLRRFPLRRGGSSVVIYSAVFFKTWAGFPACIAHGRLEAAPGGVDPTA